MEKEKKNKENKQIKFKFGRFTFLVLRNNSGWKNKGGALNTYDI